ncbi:MAG TPA: response regulator [Gaiellaceae bacterium]
MSVRDFRARPLEILVVDDDKTFGESLALFLSDDERLIVTDIACDLGTALDSTSAQHFDLALVDVRLNNQSGFQVVEALRVRHPELATLMMSGLDESEIEAARSPAAPRACSRRPISRAEVRRPCSTPTSQGSTASLSKPTNGLVRRPRSP